MADGAPQGDVPSITPTQSDEVHHGSSPRGDGGRREAPHSMPAVTEAPAAAKAGQRTPTPGDGGDQVDAEVAAGGSSLGGKGVPNGDADRPVLNGDSNVEHPALSVTGGAPDTAGGTAGTEADGADAAVVSTGGAAAKGPAGHEPSGGVVSSAAPAAAPAVGDDSSSAINRRIASALAAARPSPEGYTSPSIGSGPGGRAVDTEPLSSDGGQCAEASDDPTATSDHDRPGDTESVDSGVEDADARGGGDASSEGGLVASEAYAFDADVAASGDAERDAESDEAQGASAGDDSSEAGDSTASPSAETSEAQQRTRRRSSAVSVDRTLAAGSRLYASAVAQRARQDTRRRKLSAEYTFRPMLSPKAADIKSTQPAGERLYARAIARIQSEPERIKASLREQGITFKPQINSKQAEKARAGADAVHDRLYATHERHVSARKARGEALFKAAHPFKPETTAKAKEAKPRYKEVAKQESRAGAVDPEYTFHPKVTVLEGATVDSKPFVARMEEDLRKRRQLAKRRAAEEEARRLAAEREAQCTPEATKKVVRSPEEVQSWVSRQSAREAARRAELERRAQQQAASFKPHISEQSRRMMQDRQQGSLFDRLRDDARARAARRKEVEQVAVAECTFVPKVSEPLRTAARRANPQSSRDKLARTADRRAHRAAPDAVKALQRAYGAEMREMRRAQRRARRRHSSSAEVVEAAAAAVAALDAPPPPSVFDRLVADTERRMEQGGGKREMWERIRTLKSELDCTYTPEVNTHVPRGPATARGDGAAADGAGGDGDSTGEGAPAEPFWQRLTVGKQEWERRREKNEAELRRRELEGATFKPQINRPSSSVASARARGSSASSESIHDALYLDAEALEEKRAHLRAAAEAAERATLRDVPQTNHNSGGGKASEPAFDKSTAEGLRAAAFAGAARKRGKGTSLRRGTFFGAFPAQPPPPPPDAPSTASKRAKPATAAAGRQRRQSPLATSPVKTGSASSRAQASRTAASVRAEAEAAVVRRRGLRSSQQRGSFFGTFPTRSGGVSGAGDAAQAPAAAVRDAGDGDGAARIDGNDNDDGGDSGGVAQRVAPGVGTLEAVAEGDDDDEDDAGDAPEEVPQPPREEPPPLPPSPPPDSGGDDDTDVTIDGAVAVDDDDDDDDDDDNDDDGGNKEQQEEEGSGSAGAEEAAGAQ